MPRNIFGVTLVSTKEYAAVVRERDTMEQGLTEARTQLTSYEQSLEQERTLRETIEKEREESERLAELYSREAGQYRHDAEAVRKEAEKYKRASEQLSKEAGKLRDALEVQAVVNGNGNGKKNGNNGLSKIEIEVLRGYVIPEVCDTSPEKKIQYSEHHQPKGIERVIERLAGCPYVTRVIRDANKYSSRQTRIKKNPSKSGENTIGIIFANDFGALITAHTTAKTEEQLEFVYRLLKKELNISD